jgi:Tol biopolymer transport system component
VVLAPGTRLGPYEVAARIGVGGMGEVYRATDVNLGRQVAIKVLPDSFAHDPAQLARFEREARTLASLNHPNIAGIYGLEKADDICALVMELVEGPTLADRIEQGPIPIDEALPIATQIVVGLEAAHEQGIVHRDLKPSNIKLRSDGTVKVLDFGLAKTLEPAGGSDLTRPSELSHSPTIATPAMTQAGVILGTTAYMSPEQARGKSVDRRTDIWAFGCVLYEMLTGRRLFEGDGAMDTLALVFAKTPDWSALPPRVPPAITSLLKRCLERDHVKRLRDVAAIRFTLEDVVALSADRQLPVSKSTGAWLTRMAWLAVAALAGMLVSAAALRSVTDSRAPQIQMRLQLATPASSSPLQFALSPDGRYLAFVASGDGQPRLWLRALAHEEARPLAGTEGARYPFWSADSRSIGFFTPGALHRVSVAGGSPQKLADAPNGVGGAWNADGTVIFAPAASFPLSRVPAVGGPSSSLTHLGEKQAGHRFPQFLSDGHRFLFYVSGEPEQSGVYLGSLDGAEPKRLTAAESAAAFLAPDWVVFAQQGSLIGRRLDLSREELTGDPLTFAGRVGTESTGLGGFSVSSVGHVALREGGDQFSQLTWRERSGMALGERVDTTGVQYPELSPDDRRVAAQRRSNGNYDIWLLDLTRAAWTRVTDDPANDQLPVWSPEGTRIAFSSNRTGRNILYVKTVGGTGREELLVDTPNAKQPQSWSADGRFLLYYEIDPKTGRDLWSFDMRRKERRVVANEPFEERGGQLSPDSRWLAYETNRSGQFEIVVQSFPAATAIWPVSTGGGAHPRWSQSGREIYFISPELMMMAAPVKPAPGAEMSDTLEVGRPVPLFPVHVVGGTLTEFVKAQYSVSRDGRFLMNEPVEGRESVPITLILNWSAKPE